MTSIREMVNRLQIVLQAEEDLYVRLRSLLRREESELIGLDPSVLETTVAEKRTFAEEARLLEESRTVLTGELCRALGLGEDDWRLGSLLAHLGDDAGEHPALHARLKALITSTQSLLESNQSFANRSLQRVQDTLRALGETVPDATGYGPGARRTVTGGRGRLVRQAI